MTSLRNRRLLNLHPAMPSSSDGKARARVQSVDSGVESVVVPVLLQQQVVLLVKWVYWLINFLTKV